MALLNTIGFVAVIAIVGWVIWANTKPIPDEPCDYSQCDTCHFPCERHGK